MEIYSKARYRLSDLLSSQLIDRMKSNLKRWIENGAPDKGDLDDDNYKILKQLYMKRKDLLYFNNAGVVACKRKEEDRVLHENISITLTQLNQSELFFAHSTRWGHQGVQNVYNWIKKRIEWPCLKNACENGISACLSCQQAKESRLPTVRLRKQYQSVRSWAIDGVVDEYFLTRELG